MSGPEELEYLEFDVVKEDWTKYKLEDGAILKSKFILGTVLKKKGVEGEYSLNGETVTFAVVPKELWGPPSTKRYTRQELLESIDKEDMKFTCLTPDSWNVYRLKDGFTINVKLELIQVSRTNKFTEKGERIYIFNIQPLFKGKRTRT